MLNPHRNNPMVRSLQRFLVRLYRGDFKIRDKNSRQIIPLLPNSAQIKLLRAMLGQALAGKPIKCAVPKSRKRGISTLAQAWQYHLAEVRSEWNSLTVAHRAEDTTEIFSIVQRMHSYRYDEDDKTVGIARTAIRFKASGHNSKYRAMTAMGNYVASGSDTHALHVSEAALMESQSNQDAKKLAAMINSMPQKTAEVSLILESTGMGPLGMFPQICYRAESGESDYALIFISWLEDPDLTDDDFKGDYEDFEPPMTQYEHSLVDEHKATPQQLSWRRRKILNEHPEWNIKKEGNPPLFGYHYPARLDECFSEVTGAVYPRFNKDRHTRQVIDTDGWNLYRGIDYGWEGSHAFVCLWVAHNPGLPPGFAIGPDVPKEVIDQFVMYVYDPKTGRPKKANDDSCDALRYIVTTYHLTGFVYIYKALFVLGAAKVGPNGIARMILEMSNWHSPPGCDANDLTLYRAKPLAETYAGGVADSHNGAQKALTTMFNTWNITPMIACGKPAQRDNSAGEVADGVADVSILIAGETRFDPLPIDVKGNRLQVILEKTNCVRPKALTDDETEFMRKVNGQRQVGNPMMEMSTMGDSWEDD